MANPATGVSHGKTTLGNGGILPMSQVIVAANGGIKVNQAASFPTGKPPGSEVGGVFVPCAKTEAQQTRSQTEATNQM
jgi:hypothetical protein